MKIDIAKGDLQTLRSAVYTEYLSLCNSPAMRSEFNRASVVPQAIVLAKIIKKLTHALVKVHGHGCASHYYRTDLHSEL